LTPKDPCLSAPICKQEEHVSKRCQTSQGCDGFNMTVFFCLKSNFSFYVTINTPNLVFLYYKFWKQELCQVVLPPEGRYITIPYLLSKFLTILYLFVCSIICILTILWCLIKYGHHNNSRDKLQGSCEFQISLNVVKVMTSSLPVFLIVNQILTYNIVTFNKTCLKIRTSMFIRRCRISKIKGITKSMYSARFRDKT